MLTGVRAAFIGGDARQIEVIQRFSDMDATITLIGLDHLPRQFAGAAQAVLQPELFPYFDVVVLPPMGTDDAGKVQTIFSPHPLVLGDEHIANLPDHARIFTGMAPAYLRNLCRKHQIRLTEIFERDDVAIYNSIPSAEGAVMLAMENTDITLHGSRCMVLGFGRTGMTLCRTLRGLGAFVKVGVRKSEHFARAKEMGYAPFYLDRLSAEAADIDLLFNTIPTMIITAQVIANVPHWAVIIDLATSPGGTDFRFAEKRGIKAILAPGLPGMVAPKTAGQIIADCLVQLILEDLDQWGENR